MHPQLCLNEAMSRTRLNEAMYRTHLKVFYLFPCMELFSWFKRIKNHQGIAIWQSTCCRWIVHQSCDSDLMQLCHCVGHSIQRLSSWAKGCWNETNIHRVLPPSRHSKHQIDESVRDGIWCLLTADEIYLKTVRFS